MEDKLGAEGESLPLGCIILTLVYFILYWPAQEEQVKDKLGAEAEAPRRPEESVYFHPTLNPLGIPPPGKPQR